MVNTTTQVVPDSDIEGTTFYDQFAAGSGYKQEIIDPNNGLVPNPETKEDFFQRILKEIIQQRVGDGAKSQYDDGFDSGSIIIVAQPDPVVLIKP